MTSMRTLAKVLSLPSLQIQTQVIIYRHAGCNHMSCRCGRTFDWNQEPAPTMSPSGFLETSNAEPATFARLNNPVDSDDAEVQLPADEEMEVESKGGR